MPVLDGYVRPHEAAERLGLTPRTLDRRLASGEVPVYRDPRDRRWRLIPLAELERLAQPIPVTRRTIDGGTVV